MQNLLQAAINASLKAGEEILKVYQTDLLVEKKEDHSPLTLADKNANAVICEILKKTGIPILSEEGKNISYDERKDWNRIWIVDPLDGTKEFVKRNGEFTVNIALVENKIPVLGVIYVPVTRELFFGEQRLGCFKFENFNRIISSLDEFISQSRRLPQKSEVEKFTLVASRSHITRETMDYIEKMKAIHGEVNIISAGSSLKFCLVAEGKANVYPRFGPTMEWDTAAGQAIVQSMGKKVTDNGTRQTLLYNKENLLNGNFIAE